MKKKKVYRLKKGVKIFLFFLILLGVLGYFAYSKQEEYLYTKTYEYKFLNKCAKTKSENEKKKCYTMDDYNLFTSRLSESELDIILEYDYNEFIPKFVEREYFIFNNLNDYLSQVITQEDDFFKYHGTEGYDYDYIVAKTNVSAINPFYENTKATNVENNYSILVNKYNYLESTYEPDDLVAIDWKYRLGGAKDYKYARSEVVSAYLKMWEDAKVEGIYLLVDSGYRSYKKQEEVYNYYVNLKGTKQADLIAARPGYSEHQTGLALDIYSKECADATKFKDSKTYQWLINNSYKYGFILRYPEKCSTDSKYKCVELTGFDYESWHYRYVGKELAKKIYESNLTFDEYYAFYINKN